MLYCIISSLIWAFSYGIIKTQLQGLDVNLVTFCRIAIALIIFLPFLRWKDFSIQETVGLILMGAIQYGIMYFFFMRSFQYLEAHQVALFTTLTPLYVVLLNDLLVLKFRMASFFISVIAVIGGGVIYYQYADNHNLMIGFILMQMSDICFAFGQIAYKKFRASKSMIKDHHVFGFLFIGALLVAAISTTETQGWSGFQAMTVKQIGVLFYLGAIASGIGFFCWNKGATLVGTTSLAVLNNLKAPLGIAVSLLFFHEQTNIVRLMIGFSFIFSALFLSLKRI